MRRELVASFHNSPVEVKGYVHQLLLYTPLEEEHEIKDRASREEVRQQGIEFEIILPITPRLGEEIEISFLQETGKYYRGYEHEVRHRINGTTQEIQLEIHPWNDYYYKWVKMKEAYESRKLWLKRLDNEDYNN